jgi:hypothetical protein
MQGKTVWGLRVEAQEDVVRISGLPGVNGALEARHGAYKFVTEDGQAHKGNDQQWDLRTSLRYALLSYRNALNAAISNAAWPRQRGQTTRTSRVAELARLQEQTNAMLLQLMARLQNQPRDDNDKDKGQGK